MTAIDYAQARIQSRHGARATETAWNAAHASVTLAALLETARASGLKPWVAGIDTTQGEDELELQLRERLRERIAEVAGWMPPEWRAAMRHTALLLDLPARQHLLLGRPALAWMARESALAPWLNAAPDEERAERLRAEWLQAWRALWPDPPAGDAAGLEELVRAVQSHLEAFAASDADDAPALRRALQDRLEVLFRRHALAPAAAFIHVALLALDLERLRGEIVARAVKRELGPGLRRGDEK